MLGLMYRTHTLAAVILGVMLVLMIASVWNDSATVDELAHVPAGFGYVTQLDYRLNPEHPPLIKALAALSANIFVKPYFPTETVHWREEINSQWAQGDAFLYGFENDADRILFWSRLPLILLSVCFGWLLYRWTQKRFGEAAALTTLTFFAFSPTVLTHSRFVTTDLGAALGFFIGVTSFLAFLEKPGWRALAIAGVLLGAALLLKFSAVLLIPIYAVMLLAWILAKPHLHARERVRLLLRLSGKAALILLIAVACIWLVYGVFVWNYPQERQLADARWLLGSYGSREAVDLDLALIRNSLTRPLGEYLLGFLMVQQRSAGGNTAFFLGEVSAAGSQIYFPVLYLFKEPLALHILTFIALAFGMRKTMRSPRAERGADEFALPAGKKRWGGAVRMWIWNHFPEFSAFVVIAVYWIVSVRSPLNIGIRHVLPTFPFIYILVSRQIAAWLHLHEITDPRDILGLMKGIYETYVKIIPRYLIVGALLIWLVAETLFAFPHFMPYYNQLAAVAAQAMSSSATDANSPPASLVNGTANGWRIAVDSNYDWGQDIKRLARFVEANGIEKIAVDYFGGANPKYYLGDKFELWQSSRGPAHGWFAISASLRQAAFGTPAPGFLRKPEDSYEWLRPHQPVARIGYSIFVYQLP